MIFNKWNEEFLQELKEYLFGKHHSERNGIQFFYQIIRQHVNTMHYATSQIKHNESLLLIICLFTKYR